MNASEIVNSIYCKIVAIFNNKIGNLNFLNTTNKTNLVSSINEVKLSLASSTPYDYVNSINEEYGLSNESDYDPTLLDSFLPITLS